MTSKAKPTVVKNVETKAAVAAKAVETKAAVKTAPAVEAKTAPAAETKAVEAKKATTEAKAPAKTAAKKPAAKKTAVKKTTAAKTTKKAELKSEVYVQFSGKSYSQEDLMKIARDVWEFDLKQKAGDLKSCDLYVKPEENTAYYVMNGEFTGNFQI